MHRPLYWATLQLARPSQSTCGQIEWPGRYVARLVLIAQRGLRAKTGVFTNSSRTLADACAQVKGCKEHHSDLLYALFDALAIFSVRLYTTEVRLLPHGAKTPLWDHLHDPPPSTTSFRASIRVAAPTTPPFVYTVSIDSDSKLETRYNDESVTVAPRGRMRPCLFT